MIPGQDVYMIPGSKCDNHPTEPAIKAVCGEVDSFGHETLNMCQSCYDEFKENAEKNIGDCEWCGAVDVEIRPTRDPNEGHNGKFYDLCQICIGKQYGDVENDEENND